MDGWTAFPKIMHQFNGNKIFYFQALVQGWSCQVPWWDFLSVRDCFTAFPVAAFPEQEETSYRPRFTHSRSHWKPPPRQRFLPGKLLNSCILRYMSCITSLVSAPVHPEPRAGCESRSAPSSHAGHDTWWRLVTWHHSGSIFCHPIYCGHYGFRWVYVTTSKSLGNLLPWRDSINFKGFFGFLPNWDFLYF